jgi:YbbR domain-containing protein
MRFLRHNWPTKLASLVIAVLLADYVHRQQDNTSATVVQPLNIVPATGTRVAEPPEGTMVRITLTGPAELVQIAQTEPIKVAVETSGVRPERRVTVPVAVELSARYRDRVNVTWAPRSVSVRIVKEIVKRLPVIGQPTTEPSGWKLAEVPKVSPETVQVRGTEEAMSQVYEVRAPFPRPEGDRIDTVSTVHAYDREGRDITDRVQTEPYQVTVSAVQQPVVLQKPVGIQPLYKIPDGFRISQMAVRPQTVRLTGPVEAVRRSYYVETSQVVIVPGSPGYSGNVTVRRPGPGIEVDPPQVHLSLRVQRQR